MHETTLRRFAKLAFMVSVTGCLLGLVFAKAAADRAAADVVVYALTAGFGLEFLITCWPSEARLSGERNLR